MRTDPDLALTGRRCVPQRLLDLGMAFAFPSFDDALRDLVDPPTISLRRPSSARVDAYRAEHDLLEPTTPPSAEPPAGYRRDRFSRAVGRGSADFDRACDGLRRWVAHRRASVEVVPEGAPLTEGATVGLVMRQPGIWVLASCRIAEVIDEPDRFGFTYATLPGHMVDPYESFVITRGADGQVVFEVEMVARPASILIRAAGPIGRALQRRAVDAYLTGIEEWVADAER